MIYTYIINNYDNNILLKNDDNNEIVYIYSREIGRKPGAPLASPPQTDPPALLYIYIYIHTYIYIYCYNLSLSLYIYIYICIFLAILCICPDAPTCH